jgi:hypothetical protein
MRSDARDISIAKLSSKIVFILFRWSTSGLQKAYDTSPKFEHCNYDKLKSLHLVKLFVFPVRSHRRDVFGEP